jgi:hypothetical protein
MEVEHMKKNDLTHEKQGTRVRGKSPSKTKRKTRVSTPHGTMVIQNGLGTMKSARAIATSLKKAADASDNLTTAPFTPPWRRSTT